MARPPDPGPFRCAADWTKEGHYLPLLEADTTAFAWEWLRRSSAYRVAFDAATSGRPAPPPRHYGLERYEDPDLSVPNARPIWSTHVSLDVISARVSDPFAPRMERVDLRLLSSLVSVTIAEDEIEQLLLSDGHHFIRIDVIVGTLIGCPASLTYFLHGLSGLTGPIRALERLAALVSTGSFPKLPERSPERRHRWINELRVADALADGQDQQAIARHLFGDLIARERWRSDSASYRRRVQRLVTKARERLSAPHGFWSFR